MNRREANVGIALVIAAASTGIAAMVLGPFGPMHWTKPPAVTVVSAAGDPRIELVRDAVAFWNRTLTEIGSPFRLGEVTVVTGSVPDDDLQALSDEVLRRAWRLTLPASIDRYPGDLLVILSDAQFISFTERFGSRVVIAIKDRNSLPMTLPNVQRNVIAHELGHAIGLDHDADPTLLMCGRPAPCRPDLFASETPRFFPLSADEKAHLLSLYPASRI